MTDAFGVRRYRPGDADAVWGVHEAALRASPLSFVEDAAADADLRAIARQYRPDGEFLVGDLDGRVVATGGFLPAGDAVDVRRLRVHPDQQRRGFGSRLLEALESRARERGFDRATLETNAELRAARSLYERRGYELVGAETDPDTGERFVRYWRELDDG